MAKRPETVASFLSELTAKLQKLANKEMKVMLKLKEEEAKELGFPFNGKLDYWDLRKVFLPPVVDLSLGG
jgi:thimet oligopeptidase